jgi:Cu-Zn family superoxide dismutase
MRTLWKQLSVCSLVLAGCSAMPGASGPTASTVLIPKSGSQVSGTIRFAPAGERVRVTGTITGHKAGRAGFHIHEKGDCSANDAMSAGGHFNPAQHKHGATPLTGHAGDLGNVTFDASGRASIDVVVEGISLDSTAANGIIGRAVVVHAQEDDLQTDPTGNAGARVACGVIG